MVYQTGPTSFTKRTPHFAGVPVAMVSLGFFVLDRLVSARFHSRGLGFHRWNCARAADGELAELWTFLVCEKGGKPTVEVAKKSVVPQGKKR